MDAYVLLNLVVELLIFKLGFPKLHGVILYEVVELIFSGYFQSRVPGPIVS